MDELRCFSSPLLHNEVVVALVVVVVVVMMMMTTTTTTATTTTTTRMMTKTRLRAGRSGVPFPNGIRKLSFLINALSLLWHTQTYIRGGGHRHYFWGLKRPRREVYRSLPSSAEVNNLGYIPLFHLHNFVACTGRTLPCFKSILANSSVSHFIL